jgi:uncharacterized protein (TIGR03435 family)
MVVMTKRAECVALTILLIAAASISLACPMLVAQTAPSFDVATIKPHPFAARSSWFGIRTTPDGTYAASVALVNLVRSAYAYQLFDQVSGGPNWARTDLFDLQAKMSEADVAVMQTLDSAEATARRKQMMQAFLAERFKLKVHSETRQAPVFELVVTKNGPHLNDAATDTSDLPWKKKDGTFQTGILFSRDGTGTAQGESMESFVTFLSSPNAGVSRPIIDKTGLTGTYNFTLHWSPPPPAEWGTAASDDAMQRALNEVGLKLQSATGPIEIIVIDHAEHPTEN